METERIDPQDDVSLPVSVDDHRRLSQAATGQAVIGAGGCLADFQTIADNSTRSAQAAQFQEMANARVGPVQLMSHGANFHRRLLGAKAEETTMLKVWGDGEFYAWDRSHERKDHHHAHVWTAKGEHDEALVEGHVVTAKGKGADRAKRNLTEIKITGAKDANDHWTVDSSASGQRLELDGSDLVPQASHAVQEELVRLHLATAVFNLLNTPDEDLGYVSDDAELIETDLANQLRQKQEQRAAERAAEAAAASDADDGGMGFNLFD